MPEVNRLVVEQLSPFPQRHLNGWSVNLVGPGNTSMRVYSSVGVWGRGKVDVCIVMHVSYCLQNTVVQVWPEFQEETWFSPLISKHPNNYFQFVSDTIISYCFIIQVFVRFKFRQDKFLCYSIEIVMWFYQELMEVNVWYPFRVDIKSLDQSER